MVVIPRSIYRIFARRCHGRRAADRPVPDRPAISGRRDQSGWDENVMESVSRCVNTTMIYTFQTSLTERGSATHNGKAIRRGHGVPCPYQRGNKNKVGDGFGNAK